MITFSGTLMSDGKKHEVTGEYGEHQGRVFSGWKGWVKGKSGSRVGVGDFILVLQDGRKGIVSVTGVSASDGGEVSSFTGRGPTPR